MDQFCSEQGIPRDTSLTGLQYLKIHLGKQLKKKGQFKTMQDLLMIRVDAFVALRLALKMCQSREELLQFKQPENGSCQVTEKKDISGVSGSNIISPQNSWSNAETSRSDS